MAFDAIREAHWDKKVKNDKEKVMRKICFIFKYRYTKAALDKWRETSYHEVRTLFESMDE